MGTMTRAGKARSAGLLNGVESTPFTYLALGTSDTPENEQQEALVAEITTDGGQRAAAECTRQTTNVSNDTTQWRKVFTFTGPLSIKECSVQDAPSGGTMYARHVFPAPKNVENGDTLTLTVKAVQTQG